MIPQLGSAEIALVFNTQNTRKVWTARANNRTDSGRDMVHFTTTAGIVSLAYNTLDGRWEIQFNKAHAAWGDYVKAMARALYLILTTLKAAGLPFDAPLSPAGVQITVTATDSAQTFVRWDAPLNALTAIMPEQIGATV